MTPEDVPVAYEVFAGNQTDVTRRWRQWESSGRYGQAQRVWVMDRGDGRRGELDVVAGAWALYRVGTPKSQVRQFEKALLEQADWHMVGEGLEVKWVVLPDGASTKRDMLCRSRDQWAKEGAMWDRPIERLPEQCAKRDKQLQKQAVREAGPVKRRMRKWGGGGRWQRSCSR